MSISPEGWRVAVAEAKADGFDFFDWLGCVDEIGRSAELRVVLVLRRTDRPAEVRLLATAVPRDDARLDSVRDLFTGAAWHEREVAELFGIVFVGGERRRLLLTEDFEGTPMRKDDVLGARSGLTWPGAKEPGESAAHPGGAAPGRRRMVPPGVPDPEVWGNRTDPADPDPAEVAASVAGGRVRRRTR